MLRPSMSRGWPAFGCADSLHASSTRAIRSIVSSIGAGPTLQFTPMTVAPRRSSSGANVSGGVPSRRVAVLLGRHLRDDRQVADAAHGVDRRADLVQVAERLEDEQVDAALERAPRACSRKYSSRLVDAGLAPRLDADAERPDRAGDVGLVARRVPRDAARPGSVDRVQPVGQAERAELDPVGAERVGLDDVGAGAHVRLVHLGDQIRLREVQLVEERLMKMPFAYSIVPIAPSQTRTRSSSASRNGLQHQVDLHTYRVCVLERVRRRSAGTTATTQVEARSTGRPARTRLGEPVMMAEQVQPRLHRREHLVDRRLAGVDAGAARVG